MSDKKPTVEFSEDNVPGWFVFSTPQPPFHPEFPVSRKEAEELLHQMAFILGYRVEIG